MPLNNPISSAFSLLGTYPNNQYIPPSNCVGNLSGSVAVTVDRLYAFPFALTQRRVTDSIGVRVQAGVAGNARLGIYRDSQCSPRALLLDAGAISVAAPGMLTIPIVQSLGPGLYWLALVTNAAFSISKVSSGTNYICLLGDVSDAATPKGCWYRAYAYGVLPDPFAPTNALADVFALCLRFTS